MRSTSGRRLVQGDGRGGLGGHASSNSSRVRLCTGQFRGGGVPGHTEAAAEPVMALTECETHKKKKNWELDNIVWSIMHVYTHRQLVYIIHYMFPDMHMHMNLLRRSASACVHALACILMCTSIDSEIVRSFEPVWLYLELEQVWRGALPYVKMCAIIDFFRLGHMTPDIMAKVQTCPSFRALLGVVPNHDIDVKQLGRIQMDDVYWCEVNMQTQGTVLSVDNIEIYDIYTATYPNPEDLGYHVVQLDDLFEMFPHSNHVLQQMFRLVAKHC